MDREEIKGTAETSKVVSVSDITRQIKQSLEQRFARVWVQGEVSNFKRHTSGHLYFTLKDEGAQISAAMWRSRAANLLFLPEDGMKVIARGAITVYPPRGNYQMDVDQLTPVGIGELQIAFERLKRKLSAEGLFDESRKRLLPKFPERIGVITSETGAALQDIRTVLSRRFPAVELILIPVRVQGAGASDEIARALREMNRYGRVDVIIVGRGGGSLEDLWAFNEEIVARAIAASRIPVVSAVGHEIDFTIADFVADLRAPTPSAAAEMVVPDRAELLELIRNYEYTMRQGALQLIDGHRERVQSLLSSYAFNRPKDIVREYAQRLDELARVQDMKARHLFEQAHRAHESLHKRLSGLGSESILKRGYAIVRRGESVITRAEHLRHEDEATIQFQDGSVTAKVQ
ncbi:MAG: exodeoxyribonuclease VII large subunit [Ignavibacteria bacterium GWA2_54_16]|nr:MAG: exodeoxyribonuclease VII large subunit [Ignavibacteria bacterium GWA2_54_16]